MSAAPKPTVMPARRPSLCTPVAVLTAGMPPCFECWDDRHRACTDTTWDGEADDFAPCPCAAARHHTRRAVPEFRELELTPIARAPGAAPDGTWAPTQNLTSIRREVSPIAVPPI